MFYAIKVFATTVHTHVYHCRILCCMYSGAPNVGCPKNNEKYKMTLPNVMISLSKITNFICRPTKSETCMLSILTDIDGRSVISLG